MQPLRDHLRSSLQWSRKGIIDVLKDWPAEKVVYRTSIAENHVMWTLGHISLSDEWILKMLGVPGNELPDSYGTLFGYKSEVLDAPENYPDFNDVVRHFELSRRRLMNHIETTTDAELTSDLDDGGADFANTPLVALSKEAWHEGWHAGQLAILRRKIGLAPAFG